MHNSRKRWRIISVLLTIGILVFLYFFTQKNTSQDLPEESDMEAYVDTYASVFDLDSREVRDKLIRTDKKDFEGNLFEILSHGTTPLMIRRMNANSEWGEATPDICGRLNKIPIEVYTTVDLAEPFTHEAYKKTYKKFTGLDPSGGFLSSALYDVVDVSYEFVRYAALHNRPVRIHTSFFHEIINQEIPPNATNEQIDEYLNDYVVSIFEMFEPYRENIPRIEIIFANEPVWKSKLSWGWEHSALYSRYGEEWPAEIYMKLYHEAKTRGYTPGKDIFFMFNDYGIEIDNPDQKISKADLVHDTIATIKGDIAKRLNIPQEQVPLLVGFQGWAAFDQALIDKYYFFIDGQDLISIPRGKAVALISDNIRRYAELADPQDNSFPIKITEIGTYGATEEEQAEYISRWVEAVKESNKSDAIGFWTPLIRSDIKTKGEDNSLFDTTQIVTKTHEDNSMEIVGYRPRKGYYALVSELCN